MSILDPQSPPEPRTRVGAHLAEGGVILDRYEPLDIDFYGTSELPDYRVTIDPDIDPALIDEFVRRMEAARARGPRFASVVPPIPPASDWDKPEPPIPCGKKIRAIGLIFGAGVVTGAVLVLLVGWVS